MHDSHTTHESHATPDPEDIKARAKAFAKAQAEAEEAAVQTELRAAAAQGHAAYLEKCSTLGRSPFGRNRKTRRTDAALLRRVGGPKRIAIYEQTAAALRQIRTTGPMRDRSYGWAA